MHTKEKPAKPPKPEWTSRWSEGIVPEHNWITSGIPLRHRDNARLTRDGRYATKRGAAETFVMDGGLVLIVGKRGTGKTQMAAELALIFHGDKKRASIKYGTAFDLLGELRAAISLGSLPEKTRNLKDADLLIIDEFQERLGTEWENAELVNIVDARYGTYKPTIIMGNYELDELDQAISPSIISRAKETGCIVKCDWNSFR